jgi:hypothetical protein
VKVLRRCTVDEPNLRMIANDHWAACHQLDGYDAAPAPEPQLSHKRERITEAVEVEAVGAAAT